MEKVVARPRKVELDFTDAQLTSHGGWWALAQTAERLGLPAALSSVAVKRRARGASDTDTLWSLVAGGNGALSVWTRCGRTTCAGACWACARRRRAAASASIWRGWTSRR